MKLKFKDPIEQWVIIVEVLVIMIFIAGKILGRF